ncbi:hypothetical protein SKAU_G00173030 [Synaphobranchus kaupii]|uniref:Uncharacterized protein n=1 Tax=Synaphobranchus kaupii TaxID=118154 RepID=A0A9Q1FL39_SYNKA|nr:hypothetical protein SKAU_G00173030 [Synaphobranchus kaupii]
MGFKIISSWQNQSQRLRVRERKWAESRCRILQEQPKDRVRGAAHVPSVLRKSCAQTADVCLSCECGPACDRPGSAEMQLSLFSVCRVCQDLLIEQADMSLPELCGSFVSSQFS